MKYARSLCAIALLGLAFTFSVSADTCGDISCPRAPLPVPQPTLKGDMNYPVTQIALSIIQSVLSLS
jgi:hypothetical protein